MEQLYTGKQINEILGTKSESWACKGKDLLNRAEHAGLIIEAAISSPGKATLYRIVQDNFHIEGEEWRPNIFDPLYEVSSLGRYRQIENKKLVLGQKQSDGYVRTFLRKSNGTYSSMALHRIVFFSFNPQLYNLREQLTVDHINGRRDDNRLSNLRALSIAKNVEAKNQNRDKPQEILTQLIIKYGYQETINKLSKLLEE